MLTYLDAYNKIKQFILFKAIIWKTWDEKYAIKESKNYFFANYIIICSDAKRFFAQVKRPILVQEY